MSDTKPWLGNGKATAEVLKKHDQRIKKKFGQNFLIDTRVLERIVEAADLTKEDFVLEIGPGIGTLTQYLSYNAREVLSVEIDSTLLPILADTLTGFDNVEILNEDILKVDIKKIVDEKNGGRPIKVCANLPYYITTPIIMGLLEAHVPVESMTFMVQKEVAQRMDAAPGSKAYGALSLSVQYYCETKLNANVPPNCFIPRPDVDSAVITLKTRKVKIAVSDEELMFTLIRAAFAQRRKTLLNCLRNSSELHLSKEGAEKLISESGFTETVRGETLTLAEFAKMADTYKRLFQ